MDVHFAVSRAPRRAPLPFLRHERGLKALLRRLRYALRRLSAARA